MPALVIPHATPGLVAADFDFRLYRESSATPLDASGVGVAQVRDDGHYRVTGLPQRYRLTWVVEGEQGSAEDPSPMNRKGSPADALLPFRDSGLTPDALGLAILADGSDMTDAWPLAANALPGGGGYLVSGWPVESLGRRIALLYSADGVSGSIEWSELPVANPRGLDDWQYYDFLTMLDVIAALPASRMRTVAPGWQGWFGSTETLPPDWSRPATSGNPLRCWGVWGVKYSTNNSINLERSCSVLRLSGGSFDFDFLYQVPGPDGYDHLLAREVKRELSARTDSEDVAFWTERAQLTPYNLGISGWAHSRLSVPYTGV